MELLIATMVFSVVLLVVTGGILQIARVYYKGVTESNTQNTARSIMDTVSQAIQFSGGTVTTTPSGPVPGNAYAFCVGNQQFSYTLGWQAEEGPDTAKHQSYHTLVQNNIASCTSSTAAQNVRNQAISGRDLVGPHMRLSNLTVTNVAENQYKIEVRVVYGDDDLLNGPTTSTASCKGIQAGTQFCSVSELSTVVVKRVE